MLVLNLFLLNIVFVMGTNPLVQFTVVPDVMDTIPKAVLEVTYPANLKIVQGASVTPNQVKDQPIVKWSATESNFYTLVMVDPDTKGKNSKSFHHWLVGNIPGNDFGKGNDLAEYVGALPPVNTGLHRYIFILYQQPGKIMFDENKILNRALKNRSNFMIKEFADKYKLGEPIAANFYQAEYDEHVPKLFQQVATKFSFQ